jgi:hypothetical protein
LLVIWLIFCIAIPKFAVLIFSAARLEVIEDESDDENDGLLIISVREAA